MGTKVVYNDEYGGFNLSEKAWKRLYELGYERPNGGWFIDRYIDRHDPRLVQVVEELKEEANGNCATLAITEIKGNKYRIDEYDGLETVMEPGDYEWVEV